MEKIWFVLIHGKKEGPYDIIDLKLNERITPDTLVWKEGWQNWVPIRKVLELNQVFEDEEKQSLDNEEGARSQRSIPQEEMTLIWQEYSPHFFYWLLMALILFLYLIYHLYWLR